MGISLQNYHTRTLVFILALVVLAVITAIISGNILITNHKGKIQEAISRQLDQEVSIEKIGFRLPNSIVLKNVLVLQASQASDRVFFSVQRIEAKLSLGRLLKKKDVVLTDISISGFRIEYLKAADFLNKNFNRILKLLRSLPKTKKFGIHLRHSKVSLPQEKPTKEESVGFNFDFWVKSGKFQSTGEIYLKHPFLKKRHLFEFGKAGNSLKYTFKGYLTKKGLAIENLGLNHKKGDLKLWGVFESGILRLNGFTTLYNFFAPSHEQELPLLAFIDKVKTFFRKIRVPTAIVGPSSSDLTIYDLGCVIKFYFPKIEIDSIAFSLKNVPIELSGDIAFLDSPVIDLALSSFPHQAAKLRGENPKSYSFKVKGLLRNGTFSGVIDSEFMRLRPGENSLDSLGIILKKAALTPLEDWRFDTHCEQAKAIYKTSSNEYTLLFNDTQIIFDFKDERFKGFEIKSGIYDGSLEGNGYIDAWAFPLEAVFNILIRDVTPKKLKSLLAYFSNIEGKLASRINYQNKPKSKVIGQLLIRDGYLHDFDFFDWLADFFEIPSLATMDFDVLTADFLVDDKVSKLEDISFNYKGISLKGYFRQFRNDLVASKLSLGLSREILQKSPKFNSLLKLLGREFDSLSFDFQLSGVFDDLNFKWLDSKFKEKLKEKIPDFIERGIERKIEAIIKSAPE